jgi:hypothetical protein
MRYTVIEVIATLVCAINNYDKCDNYEEALNHTEKLLTFVKEHLPSKEDLNGEVSVEVEDSTENCIDIFIRYDLYRWHVVSCKASFIRGIDIYIPFESDENIKTHLADLFRDHLLKEVVL